MNQSLVVVKWMMFPTTIPLDGVAVRSSAFFVRVIETGEAPGVPLHSSPSWELLSPAPEQPPPRYSNHSSVTFKSGPHRSSCSVTSKRKKMVLRESQSSISSDRVVPEMAGTVSVQPRGGRRTQAPR